MAVTYTLLPLPGGATGFNFRAAVRGVLVSVAAGASEAITLVHNLIPSLGGACPTEIRMMLRSIVTSASAILGQPLVNTLNASQAVVNFGGGAGTPATVVMADIIAEFTTAAVS